MRFNFINIYLYICGLHTSLTGWLADVQQKFYILAQFHLLSVGKGVNTKKQ